MILVLPGYGNDSFVCGGVGYKLVGGVQFKETMKVLKLNYLLSL